MSTNRSEWALSGLVAGLAGLATSYFAATLLGVRDSPVVAVAEAIVQLTPGRVVEWAIGQLGHWDKPVLVGGILLVLTLVFAGIGALARRGGWLPTVAFASLAGVGVLAVLVGDATAPSVYLPLAVGFATWVGVLELLTRPLRATAKVGEAAGGSRRSFLLGAAGVVVLAAGLTGLGRLVGRGRRSVESERALLRLPGVTEPKVPAEARIGLPGVSPWQTDEEDFYLIHTALAIPTIAPEEWRLRIHGMVDRELTLSFQDLLDRRRTEAWVTLNCVSNPIGGELIGNAWWSGVRLAGLLEEAGVRTGADAVLQTSEDGWTCGTPLSALTDKERGAMLAIAMNGRPLPVEHGFPVRTLVPGLYGFVSATKWVVDLEVTTFDSFDAYWTTKGWAEQAPVRLASRIDVPRSGDDVAAGDVRVGGVAWAQYVGIAGVEVSVDGGAWQPAEIASPPTDDTWVQWAGTVSLEPGDHVLRVRATSKQGETQTGVERGVVPDGATGWHQVDVTATDA